MSGFVTYLIVYYTKYFQGNFYVNYSLQGFADSISLFYVMMFQRRYSKVTHTLYFLTYLIICLTISQILMNKYLPISWQSTILPFMILVIKLSVTGIQNYGYHINTSLFPVLLRGRAMGITNFVSRPFAGMATIVTEYTDSPLNYILGFAISALFVI